LDEKIQEALKVEPESELPPARSRQELLEEILEIVRRIDRAKFTFYPEGFLENNFLD
jgi:hypothetical protein